jgi:FkbM family methyltransferase
MVEMDELCVRVKGGGEICAPAGNSMTTYVLLEQEDWFEKETAFVRRLLRPGMRAVDIGANYGCYSLAISRAVGPEGRVWAYEPSSETARYLRKTIVRNGLANVELLQAAVCDRMGTGRLRRNEQPELNRLDVHGDGEEVSLTTVDAECRAHAWGRIDFVKIDAEGGEWEILRGGKEFFAEQSPLVMFERTAESGDNAGVQSAFRASGYSLFKLIGPDFYLVLVGENERFDDFDLNLFACKADRADKLLAAGLLTTRCAVAPNGAAGLGIELWRRQDFAPAFAMGGAALDPAYERALDAYAVWRDADHALAERCGALFASAQMLRTLVADQTNLARLCTCARVAHEAGMRSLAIECLSRMLDVMNRGRPQVREPFWPAAARYDSISPGGDRDIWFLAATFEAYEERRAFSSYFAVPGGTLLALDWLSSTPYATPAMERRRQLVAIRAGRQRERQSSPLLSKASAGHLNPQLWGAGGQTTETTGGGAGGIRTLDTP